MFFKNLNLFRASLDEPLEAAALEQALEADALVPCQPQQPQSIGWVSPFGRRGRVLSHAAGGCYLVALGQQQRLLPAAVIRDELEARCEELEAREGAPVGRKRQRELREDIELELLPRAFVCEKRMLAYLDTRAGWLVVDSAASSRAEELVALLRKAVPGLQVSRPAEPGRIREILTGWLTEQPAGGFELGDEVDLKDQGEEGAVARCRKQALDGPEVAEHLRAGKAVVSLGFAWDERLGGVLTEELNVKRFRFTDVVTEQLDDDATDTVEAQLDASFTLMTLELRRLFAALQPLFMDEESRAAA